MTFRIWQVHLLYSFKPLIDKKKQKQKKTKTKKKNKQKKLIYKTKKKSQVKSIVCKFFVQSTAWFWGQISFTIHGSRI